MLSYVKIVNPQRSNERRLLMCVLPTWSLSSTSLQAILFSVIYNRHSTVSKEVNVLISVQFIIFPPLVHPIIYGIRTKEIRTCITKIIRTRIFPNSLDFPHRKSERKLVPIMTLDGTAAGQGLPVWIPGITRTYDRMWAARTECFYHQPNRLFLLCFAFFCELLCILLSLFYCRKVK